MTRFKSFQAVSTFASQVSRAGLVSAWVLALGLLTACGGGGSAAPPPATLPGAGVFATKITGAVHTLAGVQNTFKVKSGNGTVASNTFDWGDATQAVGLTAVKSYPAPGSYTVATVSVNSAGVSAAQNKNVLVAANPVVAGEAFTCALNNDATVSCWGLNDLGRTGQSFTVPSSVTAVPTLVAGLIDVGVLTAGNAHACVIKLGGTVWCWGNNDEGQLGNGSGGGHVTRAPGSFSFTPVQVPGIADALAISAGYSHTCAILRTGLTVTCWGNDSEGQLGRGRAGGGQIINSTVPVAVLGLANVVALAAGSMHNCAVVQGGQVSCWGSNSFGQLGNNTLVRKTSPVAIAVTDAESLALGATHSCAIRGSSQTIHCWGDNRFGQLGSTGAGTGSLVPVQATGALATQNRALSASLAYTCALRLDGGVACWGDDRATFGTSATIVNQPTAVAGVAGAVAVAAGTGHGCALQSWGDVICWGSDANGRLGRGPSSNAFKYTPASTSAGAVFWHDVTTTVTHPLSVAPGFGCAIKDAGGVQCWYYLGEDVGGTLNSFAFDATNSANVIGLKRGGANSICAIFDDGSVGCANFDSSLNSQNKLVIALDFSAKVPGIVGAVDMTDYGQGGCAVLANGKVECWGYNFNGAQGYPADSLDQSGAPVATINHAPREVPGVSDAVQIASFYGSVCVRKRNKTAMCWGSNESSQAGNAVVENPSASYYFDRFNHTPTTVAGLADVLDISLADRRACAVVAAVPVNKLYCWGYVPELNALSIPTPTLSSGMSGLITAVTVGESRATCGVQSNNDVKCSGVNPVGQLGIANGNLEISQYYQNTYYSAGHAVPNLPNVTALDGSLEGLNFCALNTSGQMLCWGARTITPSDPQVAHDAMGNPTVSVSYAANPTPTASPGGAIFWRP